METQPPSLPRLGVALRRGMTGAEMPDSDKKPERILFVTGRLAEPSLRRVLADMSDPASGPVFDVAVLGISVAALMHVDWVRQKLVLPGEFDRVILPGWCQGDVEDLSLHFGVPFERGPKDLFDLPAWFSGRAREPADLSAWDIEIVAEINHAPRMSEQDIVRLARRFAAHGADVIDIGCIPGESWSGVGEVVRRLRDDGLRVSVDSFDRAEVESAVRAGASLVFSGNSSNVEWVGQLGVEVVVVPDEIRRVESLEPTMDRLTELKCPFRIDPILEPIGFGFAASLGRYYEVRARWPEVPMLMGTGNVTELTEADTAGMNVLLAALCQELGIFSVLTTEVIPWACSVVRELDVARRLVRYAVERQVLPKHVDSRLVMLHDPRVNSPGEAELAELAARLRDPGFRVFVEGGEIHLMNRDGYWRGRDPFEVFDQVLAACDLDPAHAFYLGYELSKAVTAITLEKQYTQDQALRWGLLTIPEVSAHARRRAERGGAAGQ